MIKVQQTMITIQIQSGLSNLKMIALFLIITSIVTPNLMIVETEGLANEDEIIDKIDKEAEMINEIMDQKIKSHTGLGDIFSYCYESVGALEECQNEIVEEMEPYYDDAGKRISDKIENNVP